MDVVGDGMRVAERGGSATLRGVGNVSSPNSTSK